MNTFTSIFLAVLGLMLATQLWLAWRHIRHVEARRQSVPGTFEGRIPLDAHRKAADYTVARTRLGQIDDAYGAVLLLVLTVGGGLSLLDRFWRALLDAEIAVGTLYLVSLFVILGLLELPLSLYRTFVIEQRFGFNRSTPALFASDLLKKFLLGLVLGAPLAAAALWLMQAMGSRWWLYVWALWMGFSLFMVWAYPALIAPLFNRFKPLERDALRSRLQSLLERTGFRSEGIFVMDSSRRTAHGNAFFTGFGRAKRVVFFDSLLDILDEKEVEAVVAHELGHFKLKHIAKRLLLMALVGLAALALLGWLIGQPWFYGGLGVSHPSNHAALALFLLVGPVFTFFLSPLLARSSRRHEYEADAFAARESDVQALINALVKLYKDNAATLTPDPLHSAFYDSHPPAAARIAHLLGKAA
ncbi:peptidase M48 [Sulfurifustis variabilis]|uniref:Peptidase M48 n=1 Tax=Sulfurifustis variabilis TaxID=1675686 RepID=A0A1B4V3M9_9GAMM|nr:M48 family metallopeptidase [Sulfurifustis variabilis]BAU48166.1 peptidase M48 [Sulfurifustis variabilis]